MPYQDLEVGMSETKDEPSFLDKITSFFTSDPDTGGAPEPVSGGRGRVYERPNERNDYLASMLRDDGVVPPPSALDAQIGFVPPKDSPDYSGNVDRYSIPVGNMIPESLGSLGNFLPFSPDLSGVNPRAILNEFGLTDLSNMNPVTTMFMRPRDAAARFGNPEKYSPTGEREISDLIEAGMGPLEALVGLGASRYLREPIEQGLGSLFGLDVEAPTPNRSNETLPLYHGTPSEAFNPEQKVRMPDGSIEYINMFQVAGGRPGDMSTLESMAPPGAEVLETYPYGRLTTDFIGTGEGGMVKGSDDAATSQAGALAGKGIYFGSKPNISQFYRYVNSSGIPYVPYKDSKKDGVGQETLSAVQPAIIDQYGSLDEALEVYNFGDQDTFDFTVGGEKFSFKTPASVRGEVESNFENVLETVKADPVMSQYVPETTATSSSKATVNKVSQNIKRRMNEITPEFLNAQSKADNQIDRMFPLPRSYEDRIKLYDVFLSPEELSVYKEYVDLSDAQTRLNVEKTEANSPVEELRKNNKILRTILETPVEDIPGSLFFTDIAESDMGKYLDLGDPRKTFNFAPDRDVPGEIDLGTLNDMIDIFGKEWVDERLAGLPTDRAWQIVGDGPISRLEETGNPNLPYRIQDSSQEGRSVVATESVFKPRTVEEMKKLADAGYTNLKFLDASGRGSNTPSYNYVFFGDDVMPKIVDKKKDGGLIKRGLGSI